MNFFFSETGFSEGETIVLTEEETHHALKVLRLEQGAEIEVLNGKGQRAKAIISEVKKKQVLAQISSVQNPAAHPLNICIALGMLKKRDRLEWFVEKSVELGIQKIILFSSDHSEKSNFDLKRIEKISISALKQSGNLWLPEIISGISFQSLIQNENPGQKFIAHCENDMKQGLKDACLPNKDTIILIGPEGDFSSKEIIQAKEKGFVPVSLGELRLRSETAALYALMTFKLINDPS